MLGRQIFKNDQLELLHKHQEQKVGCTELVFSVAFSGIENGHIRPQVRYSQIQGDGLFLATLSVKMTSQRTEWCL